MEAVNNAEQSAPQSAPVELKRMNMTATLAICSSGWLVPGLAHVLIGRWIRSAIFASCVLLMFVLGLGMRGKLYDLEFGEALYVFACIADSGRVLIYWIAEHQNLGLGPMRSEECRV